MSLNAELENLLKSKTPISLKILSATSLCYKAIYNNVNCLIYRDDMKNDEKDDIIGKTDNFIIYKIDNDPLKLYLYRVITEKEFDVLLVNEINTKYKNRTPITVEILNKEGKVYTGTYKQIECEIPEINMMKINNVKTGDKFDFLIEKINYPHFSLVLSRVLKVKNIKKYINLDQVWDEIDNLFKCGENLRGRLIGVDNDGLKVDFEGVKCIVPESNFFYCARPKDIINNFMDFKIISVDKKERKVILSNKMIITDIIMDY